MSAFSRDCFSSAAPASTTRFWRRTSSPAFAAAAVWASTSRRAAARPCSSRADRSRSFCRSGAPRSPVCFSRETSSPACVARAVWVSTSRRAVARSCSSFPARSRACCRASCNSAPPCAVCLVGAAPSAAFAASAAWISRRAAARSRSSPSARPCSYSIRCIRLISSLALESSQDSFSADWGFCSGGCAVSAVAPCATCTGLPVSPAPCGTTSDAEGRAGSGDARVSGAHAIASTTAVVHNSAGRPSLSACRRCEPAMLQRVPTSSLRRTVRPIRNHPSQGDTIC